MSEQDMRMVNNDVKLIQGIPLAPSSIASAAPNGLNFCTTLGRRQEILGQPDPSFSSWDIQKQGQPQNGQSLAQMGNSHSTQTLTQISKRFLKLEFYFLKLSLKFCKRFLKLEFYFLI